LCIGDAVPAIEVDGQLAEIGAAAHGGVRRV
jgi:hypothetical protein